VVHGAFLLPLVLPLSPSAVAHNTRRRSAIRITLPSLAAVAAIRIALLQSRGNLRVPE